MGTNEKGVFYNYNYKGITGHIQRYKYSDLRDFTPFTSYSRPDFFAILYHEMEASRTNPLAARSCGTRPLDFVILRRTPCSMNTCSKMAPPVLSESKIS